MDEVEELCGELRDRLEGTPSVPAQSDVGRRRSRFAKKQAADDDPRASGPVPARGAQQAPGARDTEPQFERPDGITPDPGSLGKKLQSTH